MLALAHNGNLSNGKMFPVETNPNTGLAIDAEYVRARARWEPLFEVTQIKGDSESHPALSPFIWVTSYRGSQRMRLLAYSLFTRWP